VGSSRFRGGANPFFALEEVAMRLELEQEEVELLIEAIDCLKTKISFKKGATYAEKTERLLKADALEEKIKAALPRIE